MAQLSQPVGILRLGAALGEGPVWVAREAALWFVDIKKQQIHRYHPASGDRRSWDTPSPCGFVLPAADGGFVAGLQEGLFRFDPETGAFSPIVDPEPDLPGNRLNDGTVDPQGRLWFGTMDDCQRDASGRIYRLDRGGRAEPVTSPCPITNGPAFSPDGKTMYHVDTAAGLIHACEISDDGSLAGCDLFARIPAGEGHPDGPTVDSEGCLWIALYGGWAARRYSPEGALLDTVRFPVANITKLAFGGRDLTTVFATSAAQELSAEERERQPQAGDLFSFEVDVPGIEMASVRVGLER